MKNEKGFTLIELLVTIALMLSILAIAVVSVIKVRDMRKEDAYTSVKEQIITAAEHYFEDNAYYKEVLSSSTNNSITVSLGTLVNDDYLNVVTNPITGKKLNFCDSVRVNMNEDAKLVYTFEDNNSKCTANAYIEVVEQKHKGSKPTITVEQIDGKMGNNDWYVLKNDFDTETIKKSQTTLKYKITAYDKESSIVGGIKVTNNEGVTSFMDTSIEGDGTMTAIDDFSYAYSTEAKTTCYSAENELGNEAKYCVKDIKTDYEDPTCIVKSSGIEDPDGSFIDGVWPQYNYIQKPIVLNYSTTPKITLTYYDAFSGINEDNLKLYNNSDGTSSYQEEIKFDDLTIHIAGTYKLKSYIGIVEDAAGNKTTCFRKVKVTYKSGLEDLLKNTTYVSCGKTEGENQAWTNKDVTVKQTFVKKNLVGETEETEEVKKTFTESAETGTITNGAVSKTCTVNVKIDKVAPKYSYVYFNNDQNTAHMQNSYVTFKVWNALNSLVQDEYIPVKYNDSKKRYEGEACIDPSKLITSKGNDGKWNFYDYSYFATDTLSGVASYSKSFTITGTKGQASGCYSSKSKANHPCIYEDHVYVYDKAGNKSGDIGKLKMTIGFKGLDSICTK